MDNYILNDARQAVPVSFEEWLNAPQIVRHRHVAMHESRDVKVSTVFLGLDHSDGDGPPLLFETMIFGGPHDQWQERCSTWAQAVAQHRQACLIAGIQPD